MYISKHTLLVFSTGFAYCILLMLLFAAKGDFTAAATPQVLSYHGNLTDPNGVPIQGVKTMTFRLYGAAEGGVPKWEETQEVRLEEGSFQVLLGAVNPLPLPFDQPCWLGVTVEPGSELTPRTPLAAVPYSLDRRVKSLNELYDEVTLAAGENITVIPSDNTLTIAATTQLPSGGIIMWSGTNIPDGWALCDGTQGTPDLRDRFIVGAGGVYARGNTGGSTTHTHDAGSYAASSHTHGFTTGNESDGRYLTAESSGTPDRICGGDGSCPVKRWPHTHSGTTNSGGGGAIAGTSGQASSLPPYYALAFIMKL